MKKIKFQGAIMLCLVTALVLGACGGASDELAPAGIKITNTSSKNFASVVVTANAGRVVYSGSMICPAQQTCDAAYVAPTLNEPYTYRFLDASGQLVTAHIDSNSDLNVDDIETSDVMLGLHLFDLLKSSTSLTPLELSFKLDRLFTYYDSPDATPDFFEELGVYYNQQTGGSVTEAQFLVDIAVLLMNDDILPALPTMAKVQLLSQPMATASIDDIGGCQPVSAFFKIGGKLGDELKKLLPGAGLLFSTAGEVFDVSCGSSIGDLAASLADISKKLNQMDTKLTQLGYKMDGLRAQIAEVSLQNGLIEAEQHYQQLNVYISKYSGLSKGFPSLYDYIQSRGGLTKELYAGSTVIQSLFNGLSDQNALHARLLNTNNLEKIRSALETSCKDESRIGKDVIATRNGCNLVVLNLMAKVGTTHATGIRMMRDIIKVVNQARQDAVSKGDRERETWLRENFSQPFSSWETADTEAASLLGNNMSNLASKFSQSLISPIEGLSTELTGSMANARCTRSVDGETGPALLEWYSASGDATNAYIRTQCTSAGKPVNARYYYTKDGTNAVNILGVLVKAGWWSDYYRTPLSYTNIPAKTDDNWLYFNNVIPSGMILSVNNWPGSSTKIEKYIEPANNYSYGDATGPYVMYYRDYLTRLQPGPGQVTNSAPTLLSYRHTDEYTYVWLQRNEPLGNDASITLYMECITGDCQNHADPKFLKFTNSANKTFKVGWSTVERGVEKLYVEGM